MRAIEAREKLFYKEIYILHCVLGVIHVILLKLLDSIEVALKDANHLEGSSASCL